jgi:hypothetical protein
VKEEVEKETRVKAGGKQKAPDFTLISSWGYLSTVKMEIIIIPKSKISFQLARYYHLENSTLHSN